ncbi:MAG: TraB/GumN family protein [Xanthomonadales bacterium]|nr:hypothetical protein [Xanthomonadales bacterium]MCC6594694.1 TraB/GumN family protein [Xanthomonadales bacterium]
MRTLLLACLLHAAPFAAVAADPVAPVDPLPTAESARLLEAVVVSGVQPGPGLWRVSRDRRVLWVLGTQSPLPRRFEWEAREVREVIAASQAVILGVSVQLKEEIGFFRGLTLLPAALSSRKDPQRKPLRELVPAQDYARWLALKAKYLGRDRGVEKQRPIFAAGKLYEKAVRRSGLSFDPVIGDLVRRTAKKHDVPLIEAEIRIDIGDPRQAIRDFADHRLDDVECFRKTLTRLETDLDVMRERANAWATGDIAGLRDLPFEDQTRTCTDAFLSSAFIRERGLDDLRQRARAAWLEAAEKALAENASTFAMLPMADLLKPDGYLAALRERGYEVEEP